MNWRSMKHTFWYAETLGDGYGGTVENRHRVAESDCRANLVGSLLEGSKQHAPILDLDVPTRYVTSSTPGHAHLYIDVAMSWWKYRRLLRHLYKCGIIEKGYYTMAKARGGSFLRTKPTKYTEKVGA